MGKKKKEPKYLRIDSDTTEEEYKNNENRFRFSFVSKSILVISESCFYNPVFKRMECNYA